MKSKTIGFPIALFLVLALSFPVAMGIDGKNFPWLDRAYASSKKVNPVGSNILVEIAKENNPAVVNVSSKKFRVERNSNFRDGMNPFPDFNDRFRERRGQPMQGAGSGLIINPDGHILTNNHVVEEADEIKVTLEDGKEYKAVLVGADPKTDIALIKIVREEGDEQPLPHLTLGDSDKLEVGEWVVAIGNPFGLDHTMTVGIVSAKGRFIGAGPYDDFIQTDASINPGNSGGPLMNMKGEVVGINTAIISGNSGGNVGIGFAIPINSAKEILTDLKENGKVVRGWLGVAIQKITPELAESFSLAHTDGALVGDVIPSSPAYRGGILRGDVIMKFDQKDVKNIEELPRLVAATPPGKTVEVEVIRNGKRERVNITIVAQEDKKERRAALTVPDQEGKS